MNSQADNRAQDIKAIFLESLDRMAGPERGSYLEETCGSDAQLRREVELLLLAHQKAGEFLDPAAFGAGLRPDQSALTEGPGSIIGRYKLLERIGEGGMAVVYMAEQTEPIRRKVALKIIKLGMDTRQVIARFEAERQALAVMDHPSIAKVLDAGATETGRPYFVMELVQGVSITEYCDKNNVSTKDRLALFLQVCNAVQHAHQKGIIHRDIKPSNVMVTHHDGTPIPKVIDFGIAKATNQKLTEKTLFTRYAHLIGTPAYMSPEQAELSDLDIDTRSDIYSLGVLLYELLTGTTPFSEEELRKAGYIEMQRVIREQEPAKPSTKLSTLGETLTDIAKHRGCTPDLLRKAVRGDLDWIVMKSLEKNRARRYETPNSLASDILRHLEHEPVLARGPSTTYRVERFFRRHRSQTIAALAMAVFAGAAIIVSSMWNRDRLRLTEAEGFRHRGILSQAREQYARADRDVALETVKPILDSRHVGPEARLLQAGILVDNRRSDEAVTILGSLLNDRPEIAGAAHSLLARILWESESSNAEKLKEIEEHRRQAEVLVPETAEAYFLRAMTALTVKEQLTALDKAIQLDPMHYESLRLRAFTYYASRKYDRLREDARVMTALRSRDPLGHSLRAMAWRQSGRYTEAIADYDRALALTPRDDPAHLRLSTERSEILLAMRDYKRVLAEASLGTNDVSPLRYHLFGALTALGDYEKATALFRQIIAPGHVARQKFRDWCAKYVFDTLEAGRSWHLADREPTGAAFLPMVEAQETYRSLSTKAHRVTTDGFSANWSPDGKRLAFSAGVHGYSGVAIFDPPTKETELLIVPGKDPRWSPDGKYIAFVRDCQFLRVAEFITAERRNQHRALAQEEVWVMKADGTEPRRLARGGWPSWSTDSATIYYHSRVDNTLCSISLATGAAEPKRVMACSNAYPSVSPDNQHVVYLEGVSLKIKDLTSQAVVAERLAPFGTWGGAGWSANGHEFCLGGRNDSDDRTGLWVVSLDSAEPARTLDGQITAGSWAPDETRLAFCLGPPYFEIWAAQLDQNTPATEALAPRQTLDEHLREMIAFYTRRIEADPCDAYAYSGRARYHDCLHDRQKAQADMRQFSTVLSGGSSSASQVATPRRFRGAIDGPLGYQLAFSVGGRDNRLAVLCVAFGQKGRCEMKVFQIPMLAMSLVGLGLLSGLDTPPTYADFTFGEPASLGPVVNDPCSSETVNCISSDGLEMYITWVTPVEDWDIRVVRRQATESDWGPAEDLGPIVNSVYQDMSATISADGLSLYFASDRPGGYGDYDVWVTTRTTKNGPWTKPTNLGPKVNSSFGDGDPWISPDGLELYFVSWRPGAYGGADIYVARRVTTNAPWAEPVNLGPVVNSAYGEVLPSLSPDGLILFFADFDLGPFRPGGYGGADIWMSRRATSLDPWQASVNIGPKINGSYDEISPRPSLDGRTLFFSSWFRPGGQGRYDIWQAPILPIVDFNGDKKVDLVDLVMLIDNWGSNQTLCDIGPMPWGDGKVDIEDLEVFMTYYEKENPPAQP